MPVKQDLLEILCCPQTRTSLKVITAEVIEKINNKISAGQIKYANGNDVKNPLEEALITVDNNRIYAVKDSIPVMLVEESIVADQLGDDILAQIPAPTSD